jgi:hypothetical protein
VRPNARAIGIEGESHPLRLVRLTSPVIRGRQEGESPSLGSLLSPSCFLPRMTGEEEDKAGERYLSFVTVWKDLEITCQRPSALSRVR